jgi:hypothetical protein
MLWCAVRSAEVQCGGMLVARELGFLGWLCAAAVHVRFWGSLSLPCPPPLILRRSRSRLRKRISTRLQTTVAPLLGSGDLMVLRFLMAGCACVCMPLRCNVKQAGWRRRRPAGRRPVALLLCLVILTKAEEEKFGMDIRATRICHLGDLTVVCFDG